ncbi:MAG: NPCBM/NEW2 domain-containing protein [Planctomycetota bacterium]
MWRASLVVAAAALAAPLRSPAQEPARVEHVAEWPRGSTPPAGPFRFELERDGGFGPLRLVHPAPPEPAAASDLRVLLWNGDTLIGSPAASTTTSERLGLLADGRPDLPLSVPVDALRRLEFTSRVDAVRGETLVAPEEGDRLYRVAGTGVDVLDGTFDGFEEGGVRFESRLGRRSYPYEEVVALFVEPLDPPESLHGRPGAVALDLVGGTRLPCVLESWDGVRARVRTAWDQQLAVPTECIALVTADDDRLLHLSELVGVAEFVGGSAFDDDLGMVFRPQVDRAVSGGPLRAGGRVHTRGIGVQAPTALTFDVGAAGYARLRGSVAIDDSTERLGHRGAAIFVVRGDGRELWRSDVVRGGGPVVALPEIDVAGVERLVLAVEMGPDLDLGDRADWLAVRLVR